LCKKKTWCRQKHHRTHGNSSETMLRTLCEMEKTFFSGCWTSVKGKRPNPIFSSISDNQQTNN
jgi:hypothetical protein